MESIIGRDKTRDKIMERVMIQLENDTYAEDYTVLEFLLNRVPNEHLIAYLEYVPKHKKKQSQ